MYKEIDFNGNVDSASDSVWGSVWVSVRDSVVASVWDSCRVIASHTTNLPIEEIKYMNSLKILCLDIFLITTLSAVTMVVNLIVITGVSYIIPISSIFVTAMVMTAIEIIVGLLYVNKIYDTFSVVTAIKNDVDESARS